MLECAGIPVPKTFESRSLWPLLDGKAASIRGEAWSELARDHIQTGAEYIVMRRDERVSLLRDQRDLLTALVAALSDEPERLEPLFREQFDAATDDADRLRVVVDQVASLTDGSARSWAELVL